MAARATVFPALMHEKVIGIVNRSQTHENKTTFNKLPIQTPNTSLFLWYAQP